MKYIKKTAALALAALVLTGSLASCGKKSESSDTGAKSTDWRDKIEYEGSFFVSPEIKLLYALDTGSVTLWDSAGDGKKLQTLKYDTSAADAIERLEKSDVNADGYNDIRIIYSENDGKSCYNLWLWDAASGQYSECPLFRSIANPQIAEDGSISCTVDKGAFGTIEKLYRFNDKLTLELASSKIKGADAVADSISKGILSGGEVAPMEGVATIDEIACTPYSVTVGGAQKAYIACSPEAEWFADAGCMGLYRNVAYENGAFVLKSYTGEAASTEEIARLLAGKDAEITFTEVLHGSMNTIPARRYQVSSAGTYMFTLVIDDNHSWYYSTDNSAFFALSASNGEAAIGETVEFAFI